MYYYSLLTLPCYDLIDQIYVACPTVDVELIFVCVVILQNSGENQCENKTFMIPMKAQCISFSSDYYY